MRQPLLAVGIAVASAGAYYLGGVLGLLLRVPPSTPSVMWPPNAILTVALLLVAPRRWGLVLIPALPMHLFVQLQTEWPLSFILAVFLTNCAEAALVAGLFRALSRDAPRINTLHRLTLFGLAAGIGTLLSSFADAAAVHRFVGEPYWNVWRHRQFSNVLAQLTIVPTAVAVARDLPRWFHGVSWRRIAEASCLGMGLIATGLYSFLEGLPRLQQLTLISNQAPLALHLPFLLWAAVRFGTAGAGVTLLATTFLAVWAAVHGSGPFSQPSSPSVVLALSMSLIVVSATVLTLAVLVEERRQAQARLNERLTFEALLSRLSGAFVEVPSDKMDAGFGTSLASVGLLLDLKCVRLYTVSRSGQGLGATYEWAHPDSRPLPAPDVARDFPWIFSRLMAFHPVVIDSLDTIPAEGEVDVRSMQAHGYRAMLVIPLVADERAVGALAFAAAHERTWSSEVVWNLKLVGEVLANALARKETEDALRASELMNSSILRSLRTGVVVVDASARVVALNGSWARLASESGMLDVREGDNLLQAIELAGQHGVRFSEIASGIASVLSGARDRFLLEFSTQTSAGPRWWAVASTPLARHGGGAVVTREDVTELRRAEHDAQRSREELAHVNRLATIGELTASLAHELNQPLAAIMTNAQAGRRLLDSQPANVDQIRAILLDIVNDDQRASEVIRRLRELLRKSDLERTLVDIPTTIRDVAHLLSSEAAVRQIGVSLQLEPAQAVVEGDRVQLQQVMLNLLQNAMDAAPAGRTSDARVSVHCRSLDAGEVVVSVEDTGPGIATGDEELVFEPFYTTKRNGMGLGLSIVRSIVDSHGGRVSARNRSDGGAVFEFVLPVLPASAESAGLRSDEPTAST
jgi:two-component system sensor kinase FixL